MIGEENGRVWTGRSVWLALILAVALSAGGCTSEPERGAGEAEPVETDLPGETASDAANPGTGTDTSGEAANAATGADTSGEAANAGTGTDAAADAWTAGVTAVSGEMTGTAMVTAIRSAAHEQYDRFTIEFGAGATVPGYHVEYIDRPLIECGSGRQIHPVGDGWLEVRLDGAAAHTEAGEPTLPERESAASGERVRRIYRTCDFEGVVTFVLAVSSPEPYRVLELSGPPRLAIDIRH